MSSGAIATLNHAEVALLFEIRRLGLSTQEIQQLCNGLQKLSPDVLKDALTVRALIWGIDQQVILDEVLECFHLAGGGN